VVWPNVKKGKQSVRVVQEKGRKPVGKRQKAGSQKNLEPSKRRTKSGSAAARNSRPGTRTLADKYLKNDRGGKGDCPVGMAGGNLSIPTGIVYNPGRTHESSEGRGGMSMGIGSQTHIDEESKRRLLYCKNSHYAQKGEMKNRRGHDMMP